MNNKEITEFDLLIESHLGLERQGPGSAEATRKALSFVEIPSRQARVLDIGCGTGGQTRLLAQSIDGWITGIDMIPEFIDIFNDTANAQDLADRVHGIVGDAMKLPFGQEKFDLIWSEGMIDSLGFERALSYWNGFLKPGGYVAVTDPSWITAQRPDVIEKFWKDAGSAIYSIESNVEAMQRAGFQFVAAFTLSEDCWMQNYFIPRQAAERALLSKYPNNEIVTEYVRKMKHEVDLYEKYKQDYGYVFYIGKKV